MITQDEIKEADELLASANMLKTAYEAAQKRADVVKQSLLIRLDKNEAVEAGPLVLGVTSQSGKASPPWKRLYFEAWIAVHGEDKWPKHSLEISELYRQPDSMGLVIIRTSTFVGDKATKKPRGKK